MTINDSATPAGSSLPNSTVDCAIVGGGLAGGLIALALAEQRPDLSIRLIEQGPSFGGNHIWSFFDSDVAAQDRWLIEPLITASWDEYDIAFPAHGRTIRSRYNSIESTRFDAHIRATLGGRAVSGCAVAAVSSTGVDLADGTHIVAHQVIDARGIDTRGVTAAGAEGWAGPHTGWQKFVGQKLHIPGGHDLLRPVVMDATVEQLDGYRFVYCLPFDAQTVFVEDTYYSDDPVIDHAVLRQRIADYAVARGWADATVLHEESGCLPVVHGGAFDAVWPGEEAGAGPVRAGARAGLFHPLTSYSLPQAVTYARHIAENAGATGTLPKQSRDFAQGHWRRMGFYRMLTRMMFFAADPPARYRILERFYRLPAPLIERFYAGQSTWRDKARVLIGRPPVSILRALRALAGRR